MLPDDGETLRTAFAVRELEPKDGATSWQLLFEVLTATAGEYFDRITRGSGTPANVEYGSSMNHPAFAEDDEMARCPERCGHR